MNLSERLKAGIYGILFGAVLVSLAGFTSGVWVTGGTATDRAMSMSRDDVVASMVPVCLEMARADSARADKLATIRAASTFLIPEMSAGQRIDALMDAGWATMPGTGVPARDIAKACLNELDLESPGFR